MFEVYVKISIAGAVVSFDNKFEYLSIRENIKSW